MTAIGSCRGQAWPVPIVRKTTARTIRAAADAPARLAAGAGMRSGKFGSGVLGTGRSTPRAGRCGPSVRKEECPENVATAWSWIARWQRESRNSQPWSEPNTPELDGYRRVSVCLFQASLLQTGEWAALSVHLQMGGTGGVLMVESCIAGRKEGGAEWKRWAPYERCLAPA